MSVQYLAMEERVGSHPTTSVGERIVERREACGLTQRMLADRLGLAQSAVSRIESGNRRVSIEELARISAALGTSPGFLIGQPLSGNRLAAAERLVVDCANESAFVQRLSQLLELGDIVTRILQLDPPGIALSLDPPQSGTPLEQGLQLAAIVREKLDLDSGPIGDLAQVAETFFGVDVGHEPIENGVAGALVQFGIGLDRVLLCLIDTGIHLTEQRATLARLLCVSICRDTELLTIDTKTGSGNAELAEREQRADAFARNFLLPATALRSIPKPVRTAAKGDGEDALEAAAWAVAHLVLTYLIPIDFATDLLNRQNWLQPQIRRRLLELDEQNLFERADFHEGWEGLHAAENVIAPPRRLADAALAAYHNGLLGIGTLARIWATDERSLHTQLAAAGYEPQFTSPAFDDRAPTRAEMRQASKAEV
jgi:transcriptional regulator with XRE-family HTH domain